MGQALDVHRLHFAFTITFHYIFPQRPVARELTGKTCDPVILNDSF